MKRPALLLVALAALSASAGTDCWTYVPGSPRGTISWTDSSGFENVVKGIVLDGTGVKIAANQNRNSPTIRNLDLSLPVRDESGADLAWSPDVLKGDNSNNVIGYSTYLTNIVLPSACTSLGRYCFKVDTALVRVRLNDGLVSIGPEAFNGCTGLVSVANFLPDTVASVGASAFCDCRALEGDCTAAGLSSLGSRAFKNCFALASFDCSASPLESIDIYAFFDDKNLVSVALPDTLVFIGGGAFSGCKALRTVTPMLPPKLETLGSDNDPAWGKSAPLEGRVFSPYTLERVGNRAFHSSSVETFEAAKKGLKSIGLYAFYNDTKITNVVLSATMESLSSEWFAYTGTEGVEQHVWFRNLPATLPSDLWKGTKKQNVTVHLPWSKQKEWRAWVASGPSGHTFAFEGETKTLPEHRNEVGTWQSGVLQYVTWWKDVDAPTLVLFK